MKQPIIEIPRAREDWIIGLAKLGIIKFTNKGIRINENRPHTPGSN